MTDVVTNTVPSLRDEAAAAAATAAAASGAEVRELAEVPDLTAVALLFESIWQPEPGSQPVNAELLKAMVAAGNYVAGAFDGPRLLGACFGFFGRPAKGACTATSPGSCRPGSAAASASRSSCTSVRGRCTRTSR